MPPAVRIELKAELEPLPMTINIYARHSKTCPNVADQYHLKCHCPKWFRFNWNHDPAVLNKRKLRRGQNLWTSGTRSRAEALRISLKLEKQLDDLASGKAPAESGITVQAAINDWLEHRTSKWKQKFPKEKPPSLQDQKRSNAKADLMGRKLVEWCEEQGILMLSGFTPNHGAKFQASLPFDSAKSSSLSVHWSLIQQFFKICVSKKFIESNPVADELLFSIQEPEIDEVVPPTTGQVQKIIHAATGHTRLLCQLMAETGMALVDAQKFGMSEEDAREFGLSRPDRRPEVSDTNLITGRRTKTGEKYRVRMSASLAKQLEALGSPAFAGKYSMVRERVNKAIADAGVQTTPHGFRHYRISQWLAQGVLVGDVSKLVGTSEKILRKTYEHIIEKAGKRLDSVQLAAAEAEHLDAVQRQVSMVEITQ